jgi:glycosyltransferase 2 family protein
VNKLFLFGLKLIASVGLFWIILRHADFAQMKSQIGSASPVPMAFAVAACTAALPLVAWRWRVILDIAGYHCSLGRLLAHTTVGFFFSQAMPSTIGGDGVRAALVYRDGASLSQAVRSVMIERLLGLAVLLVFSAVGVSCLAVRLESSMNLRLAEALPLVTVVIGLLCLWFVQRSQWLDDFRIGRGLRALAADAVTVLRRPRTAALFGALSLMGHLLGCATVWAVGQAIGAGLSVVDTLIVMPSVFALIALPISIAGWGLREGAMVVGLGVLGVPATTAVLISVLFGIVNLFVGLLGGAAWLMQGGIAAVSAFRPYSRESGHEEVAVVSPSSENLMV